MAGGEETVTGVIRRRTDGPGRRGSDFLRIPSLLAFLIGAAGERPVNDALLVFKR
jgi:hypothetical protein